MKNSNSKTYKIHSLASMFPMMGDADLEALVADIAAVGLREPIWLYEGEVLDGRCRLAACEKADVPLATRDFLGNRAEAMAFVWSQNYVRRHLDSSQAAACLELRRRQCAEFAAGVEKVKGETEKERRKKIGKSRRGETGKKISPSEKENRKFSTTLARAAGTNRAYVEAAAKLPDTELEAVRDGRKTMPDVIREQKRKQIKEKLESIETREAKEIDGVYDVLVIDPPWPMKKIERDLRTQSSRVRLSDDG